MISSMNFKDMKTCYIDKKNENIMIKTNMHAQNTCLTDFAKRRTRREQIIQHFLLTHYI